MKRNKLALVLGACMVMSMFNTACSNGKKEKESAKDSESKVETSEDSETESTESEASGESDPQVTESTVTASSTESTVTASSTESTVTASSTDAPSESTEGTTAAQPSETTPVKLPSLQAKDVITFGSFEQDNDTSNGPEEIEWIVLTVEDGHALLLSKYVLEGMHYDSDSDASWEESEVRAWLNGDFYEAAFSDSERASICEVELETDEPAYGRHLTTKDNVFLLEHADLGKYFEMIYWDETYQLGEYCFEVMTPATPYAEAHGALNITMNKQSATKTITEYPEVKGKITCAWWLRTSGTFVSISGSTISNVEWEPGDVLKPYHSPCEMEDKGVRPAIWIAVDTTSD